MAVALNLFERYSTPVGRQYPSAASVQETELSGLDHLLKMTSRLPSADAATQVLEQCIGVINTVVASANNQAHESGASSLSFR